MELVPILAVAMLLGLIPAAIARSKGYSFGLWWFYGAAVLVVALPIVIAQKPNPETRRACPLCRSVIEVEARICPNCGRDVYEALAAHR